MTIELDKITAQEVVDEMERELKVRESVYPRWVAENKISAGTAQWRISVLKRAASDYRKQAEKERLL